MTYGAAGHPDRRRLGKFGLGLKTASTAFSRKLSVISRDSGTAKALKATWDLDHVEKVGNWELLLDAPSKEDLALLNGVAAGHSGTVVAWESVDRLLKTYSDPGGGHARNAMSLVIDSFRAMPRWCISAFWMRRTRAQGNHYHRKRRQGEAVGSALRRA